MNRSLLGCPISAIVLDKWYASVCKGRIKRQIGFAGNPISRSICGFLPTHTLPTHTCYGGPGLLARGRWGCEWWSSSRDASDGGVGATVQNTWGEVQGRIVLTRDMDDTARASSMTEVRKQTQGLGWGWVHRSWRSRSKLFDPKKLPYLQLRRS
jgi:hypothetical protein